MIIELYAIIIVFFLLLLFSHYIQLYREMKNNTHGLLWCTAAIHSVHNNFYLTLTRKIFCMCGVLNVLSGRLDWNWTDCKTHIAVAEEFFAGAAVCYTMSILYRATILSLSCILLQSTQQQQQQQEQHQRILCTHMRRNYVNISCSTTTYIMCFVWGVYVRRT